MRKCFTGVPENPVPVFKASPAFSGKIPAPFRVLCLGAGLFFLLGCGSAPEAPGEKPAASLIFNRIEADSVDRVVLFYRLRLENPRSLPLAVELKGWNGAINGTGPDDSASLSLEGESAAELHVPLAGFSSAEKTISLNLDLSEFRKMDKACSPPAEGVPDDEYLAELTLDLHYLYADGQALREEVSASAAFPRIREPVFTITSIAILQAELINTRFRVTLRIDNPNSFPVALSFFTYELYGEGRFWAGGQEENVMYIPAGGKAETELFLVMNFINMNRRLLDEVIAMNLVRYRFHGEAEIGTDISWLPRFRMDFDRSGNSVVLR
ncbi:MAG: LEA type 2 family protein [Treponema sp.]|jgi:LEA14-like dessication related protein|nr:LEA type 2 family protein [Treponema sp.]